MSQTATHPALTAPADNANTVFQKIDDYLSALDSTFSGASLPTASAYRIAVVTGGATEPMSIYNQTSGAWKTLFPDTKSTYGGLVAGTAGAFTTAAPTSAVAASGSTDLVRKNECDNRNITFTIRLGTLSATASFFLYACNVVTKIVAVKLVSDTARAVNGTDYWSFGVYNVTDAVYLQSGTGPAAPTGNRLTASTYTAGTAITANTPYDLALNQNQGDLSTTLAAGKVIQLIVTKTGAPPSLAEVAVEVTVSVKT